MVSSSALSPSTLSAQSKHEVQVDKPKQVDWRKVDRVEIYQLEERLEAEREERDRLEREVQKLRRERELLVEREEQGTGSPAGG